MTVPTFVDVIDAMKIMARKIDDLEKRLTALEAAPVMRIHHNGPAKMLLPDEPAPAADDPDAPVECPNCGMEMWWNDYEHFYECGRDGCPIENIYFSHATDVVDAAAIVRRMRGAR